MAKFLEKKWIQKTALTLSGIGALNWAFSEIPQLGGFNLVEKITSMVGFTQYNPWVYGLVGASGVLSLGITYGFIKNRK